jgi:hypothetical protein
MGFTFVLLNPHGIPTALMTVLPLSLIPTFLVPFFLMLHIICIAQARAWRAGPSLPPRPLGSVQQFTI